MSLYMRNQRKNETEENSYCPEFKIPTNDLDYAAKEPFPEQEGKKVKNPKKLSIAIGAFTLAGGGYLLVNNPHGALGCIGAFGVFTALLLLAAKGVNSMERDFDNLHHPTPSSKAKINQRS